MKAMTFKQIVEAMEKAMTFAEIQEVYGLIDISFQAEKISWKDHELLYHLVDRLTVVK